MGDRKCFALALNKVRIARGLNNAELARSIGVSAVHVGDMLQGSRQPSVEMLERICEGLRLEAWQQVELHRAAATDQGYRVGG